MISSHKLERVLSRRGFINGLCFSSNGNSGGLGLWWNDLNIHVFSFSQHHLIVEVHDKEYNLSWMAVGIYGWPEGENNHRTWELMRSLTNSCQLSMVLFGDFTRIVSMSEKEGGAILSESVMDGFRGVGLYREYFYMAARFGLHGSIFTWQRGTKFGNIVRERLDRFLVSDEWCTMFPHSVIHEFAIYKSEHAPIMLNIEELSPQSHRGKHFHFEALWLVSEECQEVVKNS